MENSKATHERIMRQLICLKWMVGFNLAATMAVLWKILS